MIGAMTRLSTSLALILAALSPAALPLAAQEPPPIFDEFRPLPLHEIARRVSDRYVGRLIAAEARPPLPHERELGAALVYEFRLVTPRRQMLQIRVDARDGRFLEVAGRGQIEALRTGARSGPGLGPRGRPHGLPFGRGMRDED